MGSKGWSTGELLGEFKDVQASTLSLECSGSRALFAGKKDVWLLQVASPGRGLLKLSRKAATDDAEVNVCHCSPSTEHQFALASNNVAEVYAVDGSRLVEMASLRGHSRPISDLEWSWYDPHSLATCAADGYIQTWDLRQPSSPASRVKPVQCASKIKWSKVQDHVLASSHDRDIKLWDCRRIDRPVRHMMGHVHRILGLDWSPTTSMLVSTGLDNLVYVWDTGSAKEDCRKRELHAPHDTPLHRARFTPFEGTVLTAAMPQTGRADYNMLLYHVDSLPSPGSGTAPSEVSEQHAFIGHNDVVYDYHWREAEGSYQLVSWSRDQTLRLWRYESAAVQAPVRRLSHNQSVASDNGRAGGDAHGMPVGRAVAAPSRLIGSSVTSAGGIAASAGGGEWLRTAGSPSTVAAGAAVFSGKAAGAPVAAAATFELGPSLPAATGYNLQSELDSLSEVEGVRLSDVDHERQSCTVTVDCGGQHTEHLVRMRVQLPSNYGVEPASCYVDAVRPISSVSDRWCHEINADLDRTACLYSRTGRFLDSSIRLVRQRLDEILGCSLARIGRSGSGSGRGSGVAGGSCNGTSSIGGSGGGEPSTTSGSVTAISAYSSTASRSTASDGGGSNGEMFGGNGSFASSLRRSASSVLANGASMMGTMTPGAAATHSKQDTVMHGMCTSGAAFAPNGSLVVFYRSSSAVLSSTASKVGPIGSLPRTGSRPQGDAAAPSLPIPASPNVMRTPSMRGQQQPQQPSYLSRSPKSGGEYDTRSLERTMSYQRRARDDGSRAGFGSSIGIGRIAAAATAATAAAATAGSRKDRWSRVVIYDVSSSLPVSRPLASRYDVAAEASMLLHTCQRNADVARDEGRCDLVQTWRLLECMGAARSEQQLRDARSSASIAADEFRLEMEEASMLVGPTSQDVMVHYESLHDVQTLAMICCSMGSRKSGRTGTSHDTTAAAQQLAPASQQRLLGSRTLAAAAAAPPAAPVTNMSQSLILHNRSPSEPGSSTNLEVSGDAVNGGWMHTKTRHSESLSGSLEPEIRLNSYRSTSDESDVQSQQQLSEAAADEAVESAAFGGSYGLRLDSPSAHHEAAAAASAVQPVLQDSYVATYAELLLCWGQAATRARLLQCLSPDSPLLPASVSDLTVRLGCSLCGGEWLGATAATTSAVQPSGGARREPCRCTVQSGGGLGSLVRCSLCHIPVRGSLLMCHVCGHGGHTQHVASWFARKYECPTGCGCSCSAHRCNLPT